MASSHLVTPDTLDKQVWTTDGWMNDQSGQEFILIKSQSRIDGESVVNKTREAIL